MDPELRKGLEKLGLSFRECEDHEGWLISGGRRQLLCEPEDARIYKLRLMSIDGRALKHQDDFPSFYDRAELLTTLTFLTGGLTPLEAVAGLMLERYPRIDCALKYTTHSSSLEWRLEVASLVVTWWPGEVRFEVTDHSDYFSSGLMPPTHKRELSELLWEIEQVLDFAQ